MPIIQASAAPQQRGFIAKRHFSDNILILDTCSRIYSNLYNKYGNAVMAFFDFADAFPSVSIAWIFDVLVALRVPLGIRQFIAALYTQCNTYIKHNGAILFLCQVRSGVLQGCPLASLLFVLAMEPFVQLFNTFIDSQQLDRTCLCADDVGVVL